MCVSNSLVCEESGSFYVSQEYTGIIVISMIKTIPLLTWQLEIIVIQSLYRTTSLITITCDWNE